MDLLSFSLFWRLRKTKADTETNNLNAEETNKAIQDGQNNNVQHCLSS